MDTGLHWLSDSISFRAYISIAGYIVLESFGIEHRRYSWELGTVEPDIVCSIAGRMVKSWPGL